VIVLQETVSVPDSVGTEEQQNEKGLNSMELMHLAPPLRPYQPPVPYPQRLARAKLFQLEPKYASFLEVLKRVYADTHFLEALRQEPSCLQFV